MVWSMFVPMLHCGGLPCPDFVIVPPSHLVLVFLLEVLFFWTLSY